MHEKRQARPTATLKISLLVLSAFASALPLEAFGQGSPPVITNQPQSQIVIGGFNTFPRVGASGTLPLRYQWRFQGANVSGATNTSLLIRNFQPTNAGNYTVVVSNSFGMVTSTVAVLTLRYQLSVSITGTGNVDWSPFQVLFNPGEVVTLTASD